MYRVCVHLCRNAISADSFLNRRKHLQIYELQTIRVQNKFQVDWVWNVIAHPLKTDFVFRRNRRVHLNWRIHQFSRLLASEVCASAVVMLDKPCSEVVRRVLATPSIRQFPLQFPSCTSPCVITFQLGFSTNLTANKMSAYTTRSHVKQSTPL